MDDDCPLPFRRPDEVPDIQVLVSEGLPAYVFSNAVERYILTIAQ